MNDHISFSFSVDVSFVSLFACFKFFATAPRHSHLDIKTSQF